MTGDNIVMLVQQNYLVHLLGKAFLDEERHESKPTICCITLELELFLHLAQGHYCREDTCCQRTLNPSCPD